MVGISLSLGNDEQGRNGGNQVRLASAPRPLRYSPSIVEQLSLVTQRLPSIGRPPCIVSASFRRLLGHSTSRSILLHPGQLLTEVPEIVEVDGAWSSTNVRPCRCPSTARWGRSSFSFHLLEKNVAFIVSFC